MHRVSVVWTVNRCVGIIAPSHGLAEEVTMDTLSAILTNQAENGKNEKKEIKMKTNEIRLRYNSKGMFLTIVLVLLVAAGCATSRAPHYQSGFLHDYSKLKPDPEVPGLLSYEAPNAELKKYKRFMLDPITMHIAPEVNVKEGQLNPKTIQKVTEYFYEAIKKAVEPEYPIVDKPDFDVARVRVAITGVEVNRKDLKFYQYVPVALVITGVGEATGLRNRLAVVFTEAEVTESLTDRLLSAVVWQNAGETSVTTTAELRSTDVFPALDYWAKKFRERIDAIHGK
jgi:hypothetical protein